jgi:protein-L-isoaspartate(D-aspartate) O-methyltransferase
VVAEPAPLEPGPDTTVIRDRRRPGARHGAGRRHAEPPPDGSENDEPENDEELETETDLEADDVTSEDDEVGEEEEDDGDVAAIAASGSAAAAAARAKGQPYRSETAPTPSDIAVRMRDRPSAIYVIVVAVVFAAILLNGIFLGKGGIFTPLPTEVPCRAHRPSRRAPGRRRLRRRAARRVNQGIAEYRQGRDTEVVGLGSFVRGSLNGTFECPVGRHLERTLARRLRVAVALVGQAARAYPRAMGAHPGADPTGAATVRERSAMVATQLRRRGIADERVLAAMSAIPREWFVDPSVQRHAYDDAALPIASGQSISQPVSFSRPTTARRVTGRSRTGPAPATGGDPRRLPASCRSSDSRTSLRPQAPGWPLGLVDRIEIRVADGSPAPADGPFDGIVVTAAAHHPATLLDRWRTASPGHSVGHRQRLSS